MGVGGGRSREQQRGRPRERRRHQLHRHLGGSGVVGLVAGGGGEEFRQWHVRLPDAGGGQQGVVIHTSIRSSARSRSRCVRLGTCSGIAVFHTGSRVSGRCCHVVRWPSCTPDALSRSHMVTYGESIERFSCKSFGKPVARCKCTTSVLSPNREHPWQAAATRTSATHLLSAD